MRTISELYSLDGKIFLWLCSEAAFTVFSKTARNEGFKVPDEYDCILALDEDWAFVHPGVFGHMAFHYSDSLGEKPLVRVDFNKWISGSVNYTVFNKKVSACAERD